MKKQIESTDPACIICQTSALSLIKDVKNSLKKPIKIICIRDDNNCCASTDDSVILFEDMVRDTDSPFIEVETNMDETAIISFSSGTEGPPKGVCVTQANLAVNAQQNLQLGKWIETHGKTKALF